MGFEYADGERVTNNKHLAEAIDLTREGSAPADGTTGYDEVMNPNDDVVSTLRDSCFYSAIDALQKIDSAPAEHQETIDEVLDMLLDAQTAPVKEQAIVMAEAHDMLQEVWAPPTE